MAAEADASSSSKRSRSASTSKSKMSNATIGQLKDHFDLLDKNKNGVLDQVEFTNYVTTEYGLTNDQAQRAFRAWELDTDKGLSFGEFVNMLKEVADRKNSIRDDAQRQLIDLANGRNDEGEKLMMLGGGCCLCTLGLSWLPFVQYTRGLVKRMEGGDALRHAPEMNSVVVRLQKGPRKTSSGSRRNSPNPSPGSSRVSSPSSSPAPSPMSSRPSTPPSAPTANPISRT